MNWVKGFALVTCLTMPLSAIVATSASADPAAPAPAASTPAKAPAMSDADKKAKSVDCSKQADAKGLHGEARKKFRSACKHGK